MHPTIFQIGPIPIRAYGVLIALSFAIGIWLGTRRAERRGIDPVVFTDLCMAILASSIVGARLAYVIPYIDEYIKDPIDFFRVWRGGLTLYGGIVGAILGSILFTRWKKISFWAVSDICAPLVALGIGITRIGCFLNGCCYGMPTTLDLGVVFPPGCAAGGDYPGIAIHPTQLYDSAAGFLIFTGLLLVEKKIRGDGRLFLLFLMAYGLNRFFQDLLRFYDERTVAHIGSLALSGTQIFSLALVIFGGILFYLRGRKV